MKLLFVSRGFPPHGRWGTESYTLQLARAMRAKGHEVSVFHPDVRDTGGDYGLDFQHHGPFQVARVRLPRRRAKELSISYADPSLESAFQSVLERVQPDVVHFTYLLWTLSVRLIELARRRGSRTVLTATDFGLACHRGQYFDWRNRDCGGPHDAPTCARCVREPSPDDGPWLEIEAKRWLARGLASVGGLGRVVVAADLARRDACVREALSQVDAAIAPTAETERMLSHLGVESARITRLCYAVDPLPLAAANAAPASRAIHIGFLGQFAPHKGAHVLLDAVGILERRLPEAVEPWDVVLYGEGVDGRHRRYPAELRARGRSPRVFFAPPFESERVGEILAPLSCVVVPSLWRENAPLSALEARAAGIPVIASDVPGLSEILQPGLHGSLFPAGDATALADRLRDVILRRIAPRHAPSQPIDHAEHFRCVERLYSPTWPTVSPLPTAAPAGVSSASP